MRQTYKSTSAPLNYLDGPGDCVILTVVGSESGSPTEPTPTTTESQMSYPIEAQSAEAQAISGNNDMQSLISRSRTVAYEAVEQAQKDAGEPLGVNDADDIIRYYVSSERSLDMGAVRRHVVLALGVRRS